MTSSSIKKTIEKLDEMTSGAVASVSMPLGGKQRRVEEGDGESSPAEFGLWANSVLSGKKQRGRNGQGQMAVSSASTEMYPQLKKSKKLKEGSEHILEVSPRDYDTEEDYEDALRKQKIRRMKDQPDYPKDDFDPVEREEKKREDKRLEYKSKIKTKIDSSEGNTPSGKKYNSIMVVNAPNKSSFDNEVRIFKDLHWGAKDIVDTKVEDSDGGITGKIYYVDNHKYGHFKPWKDEPPISETYNLESFLDERIQESWDGIMGRTSVAEAVSPAQQAAIAIAKKKDKGVAEGKLDQLPTRGADYSKYDTDHLKTLLKPGILHRNESRFKALIRKELRKREQQDVAEGHADQQRKVFKKNGKPVGEVGIDRESSPGVGQWYMKCYAYNIDNSGYDSYEEAVSELKDCLKKDVKEGKKPDRYHIVGKNGKPANLASYANKASAIEDRDKNYPGAIVQQVGPRGKVKSVAEGFPYDVDHMPGKTTKHTSSNCTTCHGRKIMYKVGGKLFPDNKQGATKVKCPTCKGTGDKQGVTESGISDAPNLRTMSRAELEEHAKRLRVLTSEQMKGMSNQEIIDKIKEPFEDNIKDMIGESESVNVDGRDYEVEYTNGGGSPIITNISHGGKSLTNNLSGVDSKEYHRIERAIASRLSSQADSRADEGKTGPGLWANIRAKQERIKRGSGERMRKPGSRGAPSQKNLLAARRGSKD